MFKKVIITLHILWLFLWVTILVFMLLPSSQGGHPPIAIFSPFAVMFGVTGHAFLLIVQFLRSLSNRVDERYRHGVAKHGWPWQVILALVILSFLSLQAVLIVPRQLMSILRGEIDILHTVPTIVLLIVSVVALLGLVFRAHWTYRLIQTLCILYIVYLIILFVLAAYTGSISSFPVGIVLTSVSILVAFLYLFSISYGVRRFFRYEIQNKS
jgi:hypothetical protein